MASPIVVCVVEKKRTGIILIGIVHLIYILKKNTT